MVWYNGIVNARITIDKAGRIVLPKPVRDELHLQPGDSLELESSGETVTLKPARARVQLRREDGLWTYTVGEPLSQETVEETIEKVRGERDKQNSGDAK